MIDIIITTDRIGQDPEGRQFLDYIRRNEQELGIAGGVLYYEFPAYPDYEARLHTPDFLLLTKSKGIFPIKFATAPNLFAQQAAAVEGADQTITEFSSMLLGRLLRSRAVRASQASLKFDINSVVFCPGWNQEQPIEIESELVGSYDAFLRFVAGIQEQPLGEAEFAEARSIIEGAKALARPQRRIIEDPSRLLVCGRGVA